MFSDSSKRRSLRLAVRKNGGIDVRTQLHNAIENEEIELIESLLKGTVDVNARDNDGKSPLHVAVETGRLQIIEHLLKYGADANCVCTSKLEKHAQYTPLHFAVEAGSEEVIKLLLSRGANVDIKAKDSMAPLHIATMNGYISIVKDLLNHGASIHSLTLKKGYMPLHFACELGNEDAVKLLLDRGADVNGVTKNNLTPLHIATNIGHETVVKLLLQHRAIVDNQDNDGKTILHLAVEKGNLMIVEDVLKYCPDINNKSNRSSLKTAVYGHQEEYEKIIEALLEYGFVVNPADTNNPELLHVAVRRGYLQIVEHLLKYGADVNTLYNFYDSIDFTPLHTATKNKQEEVVKLLITYRADINAQTQFGQTPIFYAIENTDLNITKLLLNNGGNVKVNRELLHVAVDKESIEIVEALLQHDADINAHDESGNSPIFYAIKKSNLNITKLLLNNGANVKVNRELLHVAVDKESIEIVEALLQHDADINAHDESGNSPIFYAIKKSNLNITKLLLNNGANVKVNRELLHVAVDKESIEIVEALLQHDADINAHDESGNSPIFYAIKKSNLNITKLLLNNGANVKDNPELLHIAVTMNFLEIVEALLQHNADINARDKYGRTALHFTASIGENEDMGIRPKSRTGFPEIAKLLLSKGADVDAQTENGMTTLHAATRKKLVKVVEVLLEYNANVNYRVKNDVSPLHISAQVGRLGTAEITRMLLNKGAYVNAKAKDGSTALHFAVNYCSNFIIKVLLEHDAYVDSRDQHGRTALHLASNIGESNIVQTLLDYGSDINIADIWNQTPFNNALNKAGRYFPSPMYIPPDSNHLTVEVLYCHLVRMEDVNLYVSEKNLQAMSRCTHLNKSFCEREISRMKHEKINNANISFYDIFVLVKPANSLVKYMRNKNIVQALKSGDYEKKFPTYASVIKSNFKWGMERNELLEQGTSIFHLIFNKFRELPDVCTEKIFSYLSNKDLRILMSACRPPSQHDAPEMYTVGGEASLFKRLE